MKVPSNRVIQKKKKIVVTLNTSFNLDPSHNYLRKNINKNNIKHQI